MPETLLSPSNVLLFGLVVKDLNIDHTGGASHDPAKGGRKGVEHELSKQLKDPHAKFARIYGFSYEGFYYDLPRPVLFLVHGDGDDVSPDIGAGPPNVARSVPDAEVGGVGAGDFQVADHIKFWSYDKADYTIRMDVDNGMFQEVLLDAMLGSGADGMDARGMNARGMNARGMNARGMNARGMNARGMNARGGSSD